MRKPPLQPRLQGILAKLAEHPTFLNDDERAHLAGLLPRQAPAEAGEARPLWYWIRERFTRFSIDPLSNVGLEHLSGFRELLLRAGVTPVHESQLGYMMTPVTRDAMRRVLRGHLAPHEFSTTERELAFLLVGLMGLDDLGDLLRARLEEHLSEALRMTDDACDHAVFSAYMLGCGWLGELFEPLSGTDLETTVRLVQIYGLTRPGAVSEASLIDALSRKPKMHELVGHYPEAYERLMRAGAPLEEELKGQLTSAVSDLQARGLAKLVVATGRVDLLELMLNNSDASQRAAAAGEVFLRRALWARAAILRRLAVEAEDQVVGLLTAAASLGEPRAWIEDRLATNDWRQQQGAMLAAIRHPDGLALLRKAQSSAGESSDTTQFLALSRFTHQLLSPARQRKEIAVVLQRALHAQVSSQLFVAASELAIEVAAGVSMGWGEVLLQLGITFEGDLDERMRRCIEEPLLTPPNLDPSGRVAAALAAPERFRSAIEDSLISSNTFLEYLAAADLESMGGVESTLGRAKLAVLLGRQDGSPQSAMALLANLDEPDLASAALLRLDRGNAELVLSYDLSGSYHSIEASAIDYLENFARTDEPMLREILALFRGELTDLDELPPKLFSYTHARMHNRIADLATRPGVAPEKMRTVMRMLINKSSGDEQSLPLIRRYLEAEPDPEIAEDFLIDLSWGDWRQRQEAARFLGERAGEAGRRRLCELYFDQSDQDVLEETVRAMLRHQRERPIAGLLILPTSSYRFLNLVLDEACEEDSPEILLAALLKHYHAKKSDDDAAKHRGRRMIVTKAGPEGALIAGSSPVDVELFTRLLVYMRVLFADNEAGAFVAEVTGRPTGELLGALLDGETDKNLLCKIEWS